MGCICTQSTPLPMGLVTVLYMKYMNVHTGATQHIVILNYCALYKYSYLLTFLCCNNLAQ